jgi:hypothetical protein
MLQFTGAFLMKTVEERIDHQRARLRRKTGRKRTLEERDPWAKLPQFRVDLLEEHLKLCHTEHDALMCYYKHNHMYELSSYKVNKLYRLTDIFINHCERGHFKKVYQLDIAHTERILAYYEWQKLMWHKSPKECRFIFQKAFPDFLAVLQCRFLGIGLPHDNCLLNIRTKFVEYWKAYFVCRRNNLSIEEYYVLREGHLYMYEDVLVEYELYFRMIENALSVCQSSLFNVQADVEKLGSVSVFSEDSLLSEATQWNLLGDDL